MVGSVGDYMVDTGRECNRHIIARDWRVSRRKPAPDLSRGPINLAARHRLDPGLVAGRIEEPAQIVASDRGRHRIDQRMIVEGLVRHHGGVEHHRDAAGRYR